MRSLLLGLVAASMVLAACQPAAPTVARGTGSPASAAPATESAHPPEVQRLLAAARERGESELSLSWGETSLGGYEATPRFEALFNQMYGTNIRINFTPGPSIPDMTLKVAQEVAAGQKASTDVLLGNDGTFASLVGRNVLEEFDYASLSPRITPEVVAYPNAGVEVYGTVPAIIFNTDRVSTAEAPRRLDDALNPKWRGRIASTPYAVSFDRIAMRPDWGVEKMKAFVARLADSVSGLIRLSEVSRVATGEFDMLVIGNTDNVREPRAKGAPLWYSIPDDGAVVAFVNVGVPRTAAHPHLAKLFASLLMSKEGQAIIYELDSTDNYALPDSQSGAELKELKARGGSVLEIDVKFVVDHPEMSQLSADVTKILTERR
jgi:iron(III) transport system substrate-binding protein